MRNEKDIKENTVIETEKMAKHKDIKGPIILVIVGLLIVQSKQPLWTNVPFGITWGLVGIVSIAFGLWGIFGNEIKKAFKK